MARRRRSTKPPVDLARARRAQAKLDRLVREHPQLVGERSPQNRAGWEAALEESEEMAESKVITFRFPAELIERIDRYGAALSEQAGVELTRTQVVKKLLTIGLDAAGSAPRRKR
jgi:hypothetical protein